MILKSFLTQIIRATTTLLTNVPWPSGQGVAHGQRFAAELALAKANPVRIPTSGLRPIS